MPNKNLYPIIFLPILKSFIPSLTKQINFCGTNYGSSSKTTWPICFSKSYSMVMKLSNELTKPVLQNHITRKIKLDLNVSLISSKAPTLHSVIFSEMNTASITNKRLL